MLNFVRDAVESVEADLQAADRQQVLTALANRLGLDDFGEVIISMPNQQFPRLSSLLPKMAGDEVQDQWTGNHGVALLRQTSAFVRSLSYNISKITGEAIDGKTILDFGCGYGRILRLMWYFTPMRNLYGVDPWYRSIEECNAAGIKQNIMLSEYLPNDLPVGGAVFDICYAFSVFTHLSEKATRSAFKAVRKHTRPGGIFLITVRPVEYWALAEQMYGLLTAGDCVKAHETHGFAFSAHANKATSEPTYGDTSMTFEWIKANIEDWDIALIDRSLEDPYQIYIFLVAK